jgi:hypothetical protein
MKQPERHSFVVKVWLEETLEEAGGASWRGQIIHVRSNEQRYIARLDEIDDFIAPYLHMMGISADLPGQADHPLE